RSGVLYDTNFPPEAKPYFDTDVSDSCQTQDLTIGLYHPNRLHPGVHYRIAMVTDSGPLTTSPYTLVAQKLPETCDFNPFCVGVTGSGEGQLLIGPTRGKAPECREWRKGEDSKPCSQPLDLVFAIDTTGSMFDDIDAAKAAAGDIVNTIAGGGAD